MDRRPIAAPRDDHPSAFNGGMPNGVPAQQHRRVEAAWPRCITVQRGFAVRIRDWLREIEG
jgi:hypothetical protein